MPADVLKQVLDEFVKKESAIREEVSAVEQQIQNLQSQIDDFSQKLGFITEDQQRVFDMMSHWTTDMAMPSPEVETKAPKAAKSRKEPEPSAAPPPAEKPAEPAVAKQAEEPTPETSEPDDAVKSINEALRGLFS